jgi:hypothetical protein
VINTTAELCSSHLPVLLCLRIRPADGPAPGRDARGIGQEFIATAAAYLNRVHIPPMCIVLRIVQQPGVPLIGAGIPAQPQAHPPVLNQPERGLAVPIVAVGPDLYLHHPGARHGATDHRLDGVDADAFTSS